MSKITRFQDIPKFIHGGSYQVNSEWKYIYEWIEQQEERGELDLDPDFQRGHVWTEDKQIKYVEFVLRGGKSSRDIYFNHPGWLTDYHGKMELVDGKQRLEAVRLFMTNKLRAFGSLYSEFEDNLRIIRPDFIVHVNNLQTRAEVLQWYLDLNDGGVVHTDEELNKVRQMLKDCK